MGGVLLVEHGATCGGGKEGYAKNLAKSMGDLDNTP